MELSSRSAGVTTLAVVVRIQDGVFQPMLFARRPNTTIFQLTGCVLRKGVSHGTTPCISTLSDLPADIFVFVNVPIETTNHMFLDALVEQAARNDCGLASGILIDDKRVILHSGCEANPDGTSTDRYAGQVLKPTTIQGIRDVARMSEHFFAVRRDRLIAVGGLSAVSSERMPELQRRLTNAAHKADLRLVITPLAVATLAGSSIQRR